MIFTKDHLYDYQKVAVHHILNRDVSMLWLDMGLGKTAITLTAITELMNRNQISKVLIFGPVRVVTTVWEREAAKWEHTKHLQFGLMHGNKAKRLRVLHSDADIYLCNYENMNWLVNEIFNFNITKFDMVVYDEVSKLKNANSLRMAGGVRDRKIKGKQTKVKIRGWRTMIPHIKYRVGLTGTPASNGYLDLHGQFLAVDNGERLGTHISYYKDQYFKPDYMGWNWELDDFNKSLIEDKIADITLKMDAKDYIDLPACKTTDILVELPAKARIPYKQMEKDLWAEINGTEIEVMTRSTVCNKLLQFCNGAAYVKPGSSEYEVVHDVKLDALSDVMEEAGGNSVFCLYKYKSDAERILQRFKGAVNLTDAKNTGAVIDQWRAGQIPLLIAHPASCGHGIDGLQDAGHIVVWFGLDWSLELYQQANARINRQGQKKNVSIIRILVKDTWDMVTLDAIDRKDTTQEGLKRSVERYKRGYLNGELSFL